MILRSLPMRVLAISFIVLALPLLVDSFIFFQKAYQESIRDAKEALKNTANYRAYAISELDPVRQVLLRELSVFTDIEEQINKLPNEGMNEKLKKITEIGPHYQAYILGAGHKGAYPILAASDSSLVGKLFKHPFFIDNILSKGGQGDFLSFESSEDQKKVLPTIFVVREIHSKTSKDPIGILMVSTVVEDEFAPMMERALERGLTLNFALMTAEEVVFKATDPKLVGQFFTPLPLEKWLQIQETHRFENLSISEKPLSVIQLDKPPFFEFIFDDQVQIAYKVIVPDIDLVFLSYTTKEQLFSISIRHFLLVYTIYGLIFLIGGGITFWLSNWISRPLMQLCNLMERVGNGNLSVRFKEEPLGFEINTLGNVFNKTVDSLLENVQRTENERVLKETYQKELELGQEAQRGLLPQSVVHIPDVKIEALYLSSQEVGGDFYDIFLKDPEKLILVVADAASRGISACLYALSVRSLIRTYVSLSDDVGEILSRTNNMFFKDVGDSGMFVTAIMGIYYPRTKIFSYYSCGHVPGLIRKADGHIITLSHTGMALGVKTSETYPKTDIELNSGDMLLLYTNGLPDTTNEKHQHFTENRLKALLQQNKWDEPKVLVQGIKDEVMTFKGSMPLEEEITILCMKVL